MVALTTVYSCGFNAQQELNQSLWFLRLRAINGLRQVSANMELREDQLKTILGVLEVSPIGHGVGGGGALNGNNTWKHDRSCN